ncbi:MAG: polyribonucleotide nucleotidyltransferase [Gemmatimonadetes bacterium]|nr:polyribonucleotide nucleotidyltransferase [Gemmatimonadota bacterium]MYG17362.1 polyribonucleotide nucleotidyltransferase [Gemmatimonadota bacterium]MYH17580.1 polyribonucleotide nucleotidyltransferase [Gemmatimonadota bacterium]MYL00094.1 polyribonucleotide nucleotidyltransferase [Gemmatimonadota bacterium]
MAHRVELELAGRTLSLETGKVAKQADSSVWVQYGESVIIANVVSENRYVEGRDYLPLMVDYRERMYAAGRIPGARLRREGPPSEKEILSGRQVDHAIRPLFPKDYFYETQVSIIVLSTDMENDHDILGVIGAAAALHISDIPFKAPLAAIRMGRVEGEFVVNPTYSDLEDSDLDFVVTGTPDHIMSLEGSAHEISEDDLTDAILLCHENIKAVIEKIEELRQMVGAPERRSYDSPKTDAELADKVREIALPLVQEGNRTREKKARGDCFGRAADLAVEQLAEAYPDSENIIRDLVRDVQSADMHDMIKNEGVRVDGRGMDDIRPIWSEVGVLPRTHGSALFTRGETQSLTVTTLGSKMDEMKQDDLEGDSLKSFMLHYNFPPYSVGEVRMARGPRPRDIGHGSLAEHAIAPVIPSEDAFPYTIRIVSEILESNSSSSMATVCGATLSLMDAGVPIKSPVAGVNIGLIPDDPKPQYLTDIQGVEDHLGGMDFKVAGTREGITSVQLDVKVMAVNEEILRESFARAKTARIFILDKMAETIAETREQLSDYAPRILTVQVKQDQIGSVIGPGGKVVRGIQEETGAQINIENDGTITIAAVDAAAGEKAKQIIESMTEEPEIGKVYQGTVKRIVDFGAFVEILPGKDGLVHISEWENHRTNSMRDVTNEGDEVTVKIINIDDQGKVKLSRKQVLAAN